MALVLARIDDIVKGVSPLTLEQLDTLSDSLISMGRDIESLRRARLLASLWVRLPTEMHSAILEFVVTGATGARNRLSSNNAPIILALVCSEWRDLVYSTPRAWSHIVIQGPTWHMVRRTTSRARVYAIRSGVTPLRVTISLPFGQGTAALETGLGAITLMSELVPRCTHIKLSVLGGSTVSELMQSLQLSAPKLVSCQITFGGRSTLR